MRTVTAVLLVLLALPAQAAVLYVDASATGAGTGASWTDAYVSLQDALAAAQSGDEVWVADGVYYPDQGAAQTEGRRASTFALQNGVAVYGGFAGGEGSRDDRDPAANPAILSGDLGAPGVTGDNAFHVVTANGLGATAVLDGFTVRDGVATGTGQSANGGGLHVRGTDPTSGPTLRRLVVRANRAVLGGGLYVSGSAPSVGDVVFEENAAVGGSGGGAYVEGGAVTFEGTVFRANQAQNGGGGLFAGGSRTVTIRSSRFEANALSGFGGSGGGVSASAPVVVRDVAFVGNQAYSGGGAHLSGSADLRDVAFDSNRADFLGGAAQLSGSARIDSGTFTGNVASRGGAVHVGDPFADGVEAVLTRVVVLGNRATDTGGAVYVGRATVTLLSATVQANTADVSGGGVAVFDGLVEAVNTLVVGNTAGSGNGGGVAILRGTATLLSATVAGNSTSGDGGGVFAAETALIRNSVVGANEASGCWR